MPGTTQSTYLPTLIVLIGNRLETSKLLTSSPVVTQPAPIGSSSYDGTGVTRSYDVHVNPTPATDTVHVGAVEVVG